MLVFKPLNPFVIDHVPLFQRLILAITVSRTCKTFIESAIWKTKRNFWILKMKTSN